MMKSIHQKTLTAWLILAVGLSLIYTPSFINLFQNVWNSDRQAHGPIVLIITLWFFYFKIKQLKNHNIEYKPSRLFGWVILSLGLVLYVLGRSQNILMFDIGSLIVVIIGLILIFLGRNIVQYLWFAFFFMLFIIPLPASWVDVITQPMKIAVSYSVEHILYLFDYPIARSGVILFVGQYQLLVADACAGLNSLFTLEALGLLYLNVTQHESPLRNIVLAILIVPISFASNVTRVVILSLITYYYGDAAGQGFVHEFSGIVLFITALMLIIGTDSLLRVISSIWIRHSQLKSKKPV